MRDVLSFFAAAVAAILVGIFMMTSESSADFRQTLEAGEALTGFIFLGGRAGLVALVTYFTVGALLAPRRVRA